MSAPRQPSSGIAGLTGDPDEMTRRIDEWAQSFADKAERYKSVQEKTESIRLTAANQNGSVRVTVRADGSVDDIQFSEKIRSMPLAELSSQVMSTMRRAQGDIAERVSQVMTETLGDEDRATRGMMIGHLQERFPKEAEEEEAYVDPDPGGPEEPDDEPEQPVARPSTPSAPAASSTPVVPPTPKAAPKRPAVYDDPDEDNDEFDLLADD